MTPITQTLQFSSPKEMLQFSEKLHEWAEQLEDLARIQQHDTSTETYHDASVLDNMLTSTHVRRQSK